MNSPSLTYTTVRFALGWCNVGIWTYVLLLSIGA